MKKFVSMGIMLTLLNGKRYSAQQLAEKYETSLKTIYRAIDTLLQAGMPITAIQGKGGGYELVTQRDINSWFFTKDELSSFISFIKSNNTPLIKDNIGKIEERLDLLQNKNLIKEIDTKSKSLVIDTEIWGDKIQEDNKIKQINEAIKNLNKINIDYTSSNNNITTRTVHPYTLVYKMGLWYLYAFCESKQSFRLFKLNRIINMKISKENYVKENINTLLKPWNTDFNNSLETIEIKLITKPNLLADLSNFISDIKIIKTIKNKENIHNNKLNDELKNNNFLDEKNQYNATHNSDYFIAKNNQNINYLIQENTSDFNYKNEKISNNNPYILPLITQENFQENTLLEVSGNVLYSYGLVHRLMQYGAQIKVTFPKKLKDEILSECQKIAKIYC